MIKIDILKNIISVVLNKYLLIIFRLILKTSVRECFSQLKKVFSIKLLILLVCL